jgi:hypothetical protein
MNKTKKFKKAMGNMIGIPPPKKNTSKITLTMKAYLNAMLNSEPEYKSTYF